MKSRCQRVFSKGNEVYMRAWPSGTFDTMIFKSSAFRGCVVARQAIDLIAHDALRWQENLDKFERRGWRHQPSALRLGDALWAEQLKGCLPNPFDMAHFLPNLQPSSTSTSISISTSNSTAIATDFNLQPSTLINQQSTSTFNFQQRESHHLLSSFDTATIPHLIPSPNRLLTST